MAQKYWNQKVLLAVLETTYGVDPAPVGADDAILAQQVSLQPMEGNDVARELERAFMASDATLVADLHAKLSFRVELAPSGTAGTAPAWGKLLRACGCAQTVSVGTSVTYNPVSAGFESITLHFHYDGIRHVLTGARGTVKLMLKTGNVPHLEFEFTGRFAPATDAAQPVAVLTAFKAPVVANAANTPTFTLAGVAMALRSLSFNAGVQVEPRFLIGAADSMIVTAREELIEATVEARAMATFNPYARAAANERMPLVLQHGTIAGARAALNVPLAQLQRPTGVEQQQNIAEWPLRFVPQPDTGNDQWTLVLT